MSQDSRTSPPGLVGRRILLVEDEFFLAMDLEEVLRRAGAKVLGPVAAVDDALRLIEEDHGIDAAVLDINLGGEMVYPVADRLRAQGTPFVFATGYNGIDLPVHYRDVPRCEKPVELERVARALGRSIGNG